MNVLVLCLRYPFPLTDGEALRIFNYVKELGGKHVFDLVCLAKGPVPEPIAKIFRRVETVHVTGHPVTKAPLLKLADALSVDSFLPRFPEMEAYLERILVQRKYDLIWTATDLAYCMSAERGVPVLMDVVDDMVLQYRRELMLAKSPKQYVVRAKRLVLARAYEKRYFAPSAACLFVAEEDASCFKAFAPEARVEVIANGVDERFYAPCDPTLEEPVIVFEGSMSFGPNADAAVYLCEEILPLVLAKRPDVRVTIVGRDPPARVKTLANERITVTGFVPDVRPYFVNAAVFVCPLRFGAGIKNKILQAWSMKKAVVATPVSVGGLKYVEGKNLLVRDTPRALADAVVDLLGDVGRRRQLASGGRATVVEHYAWRAKAAELERLMLSLARGRVHAAA